MHRSDFEKLTKEMSSDNVGCQLSGHSSLQEAGTAGNFSAVFPFVVYAQDKEYETSLFS